MLLKLDLTMETSFILTTQTPKLIILWTLAIPVAQRRNLGAFLRASTPPVIPDVLQFILTDAFAYTLAPTTS